jgi:hypothetical protein
MKNIVTLAINEKGIYCDCLPKETKMIRSYLYIGYVCPICNARIGDAELIPFWDTLKKRGLTPNWN